MLKQVIVVVAMRLTVFAVVCLAVLPFAMVVRLLLAFVPEKCVLSPEVWSK
jgi:hypothetical protein